MGILISAIAVFIGCFAQAAAGTGLGLIAGGILVVFLGRENSIAFLSMLSFPLMLAVLWQNWKSVEWRLGLLMAIPALVLTPFFAWGVRFIDEAYLLLAAGLGILGCVYFLAAGHRIARLTGKLGSIVAGFASSVLNILSGSGGPPAAIYAVNAGWSPAATRGTLQVFFIAMSTVTIGSLGFPSLELQVILVLAAAAAVGTVSGMLLAKRLPADTARIAILCLAALGGLVLISSGIMEIVRHNA